MKLKLGLRLIFACEYYYAHINCCIGFYTIVGSSQNPSLRVKQ